MVITMFCIGCQYNLRGLKATTCPECGRPFDRRDRRTHLPLPLPQWRTRVTICMCLFTSRWWIALICAGVTTMLMLLIYPMLSFGMFLFALWTVCLLVAAWRLYQHKAHYQRRTLAKLLRSHGVQTKPKLQAIAGRVRNVREDRKLRRQQFAWIAAFVLIFPLTAVINYLLYARSNAAPRIMGSIGSPVLIPTDWTRSTPLFFSWPDEFPDHVEAILDNAGFEFDIDRFVGFEIQVVHLGTVCEMKLDPFQAHQLIIGPPPVTLMHRTGTFTQPIIIEFGNGGVIGIDPAGATVNAIWKRIEMWYDSEHSYTYEILEISDGRITHKLHTDRMKGLIALDGSTIQVGMTKPMMFTLGNPLHMYPARTGSMRYTLEDAPWLKTVEETPSDRQ